MNKPAKLTIRGITDNSIKKIVRESTLFFINEVFSRQILPYIEITIRTRSEIGEGVEGECRVIYSVNDYKPRKFIIDCKYSNHIDELPGLVHTIAHEIIHCKQFAKKELSKQLNKWKGEAVSSDTDYWDQPWEKEAYLKQDELFDKLVDFYAKTKVNTCQKIKYKYTEEPRQSI